MLNPTIALMGARQSGRSIVTNYLTESHEYTKVCFEDLISNALKKMDPMLETKTEPKTTIRFSTAVNNIGLEEAWNQFPDAKRLTLATMGAMREIDPMIWVKGLDGILDRTTGPVIIPDITYPEQYRWAKDRGAIMVRLIRPGLASRTAQETDAISWDRVAYPAEYVINNSGNIAHLREAVDHFVHFTSAYRPK